MDTSSGKDEGKRLIKKKSGGKILIGAKQRYPLAWRVVLDVGSLAILEGLEPRNL